jgi:hypothetical protein
VIPNTNIERRFLHRGSSTSLILLHPEIYAVVWLLRLSYFLNDTPVGICWLLCDLKFESSEWRSSILSFVQRTAQTNVIDRYEL